MTVLSHFSNIKLNSTVKTCGTDSSEHTEIKYGTEFLVEIHLNIAFVHFYISCIINCVSVGDETFRGLKEMHCKAAETK